MTTNFPIHVLVVEDLDVWQDILGEVLAEAGCQVETALTYTEAMAALACHRFDLVVIDPVLDDVNRHNRDGLRVLRYLLDEQPDTPAVVVTSSDPNRIRREVGEMSPNTLVLWKDEWNDAHFLTIVRNCLPGKEE